MRIQVKPLVSIVSGESQPDKATGSRVQAFCSLPERHIHARREPACDVTHFENRVDQCVLVIAEMTQRVDQ